MEIIMKTKLSATTVALFIACGNSALAAEIYTSEIDSVSLGGHLTVGIGEIGNDKNVQVHQISPRINIGGKRDIGNGVILDAKAEWALNYLDGGEQSFKTRLGYIGAKHKVFGRAVVGTQWSPYYDIASVVDLPLAFATDGLYNNHGNLGTGRAEKMLSYRKSFDFDNMVEVNLGAGWQGKHKEGETGATVDYDSRIQASLSVTAMNVTLGISHNTGDVDSLDAESSVFALNYGNFGSGLYAALTYTDDENFYTPSGATQALVESSRTESLLAYGFENSLNLIINYEIVENDKRDTTIFSHSALQAEYNLARSVKAYAAYQIDLGDDDPSTKDDDKWSIGLRYYL